MGDGLDRLARAARDATGGDVDEATNARGRERFEREIERGDRAGLPVAARWPWLAGAAATAVAAALALVFWPTRLVFAIDGAELHEGYVHAEQRPARARFSDGTELDFAPGARGRIAEITNHGARVNVEEGKVAFHVVHRPSAAWTAGAGPFSVQVTGTDFDVIWERERFELDLRSGSVTVRGPLLADGLALRGGQRLVADVHKSTWTVEDLVDPRAELRPAPTGDARAPAPAPSSSPSSAPIDSPSQVSPSAARDVPPARTSWRELVARGDFKRVLAEADARGVSSAIADSPLVELAALADAARYTGRGDVARSALLAERSRFPGSAEARSAAFLLGRLDEGGAPSEAVGWYDRYLAESPSGSLAGEALGRKMVTLKRTSGDSAARPSAEAYLKRYPGGPFAPAAEEIAGSK